MPAGVGSTAQPFGRSMMEASFFVVAGLVLTQSAAFAAADCPTGFKKIFDCQSTPKKGDSDVASGALDAIQICQATNAAFLVLEKSGNAPETDSAQTSQHSGSQAFTIEGIEISYAISVLEAVDPRVRFVDGQFTINLKEAKQTVSSHYTCTMK